MTDYVFLDAPSCFTNEITDIPAELMASVRSTVLKHLAQKDHDANLPDRDSLYHTIYNSTLMQTCSENPDLTQEDAEDMLLYGGWTTALRNVLKELPEICREVGMHQMPDCPPKLPNVPESAEAASTAEELMHEEFLTQEFDVTASPAFAPEHDAHLEEERKARQALYRTSKPMKRVPDRLEPDEWPELDDDYLPAFPVQYFPAPYADFVAQVAAAIHAPVDFAAASCLGAVSSAVTGRVFVRITDTFVKPLQLYIGIVGSSGSGKSPVMNIMIDPLRDWQEEALAAFREMSTANAIEGHSNPPEPESILDDVTPESLLSALARQGGRGIIFSEEGNMINIMSGATYGGRGSQPNLDVFLKGFDGSAVHCERVSREIPVMFRHVHLSMTIAVQDRLMESFAKDLALTDRGLPERMLFFIGKPQGPYNVYETRTISRDLLDMWHDRLIRLARSYREQSHTLTFSTEAQEEYLAFSQCIVDRSTEDLGGHHAVLGWASKSKEMAARLAGLLTMLKNPAAEEISLPEMRSACRMMNEYFIPHMKAAFGASNSLSAESESVLRAVRELGIKQDGPVQEAMISKKVSGQTLFKGEHRAEKVKDALQELARKGYIRAAAVSSGKRGRPSHGAWELHPELKKAR